MKKKATHSEKRNLGVTVLASVITLMSYLIAVMFLPLNISNITGMIYFAVFVGVGTIALVVAIYGRKKALKQFLESLLTFSAW